MEKALPSGFSNMFAGFSFSRKGCWLYSSFAQSGDLRDSLRMNFSGCSEKLMPLSPMQGGDGGK